MDDERIERALRQGPPDEPSYAPLARELIDAELTGRPVIADRPRERPAPPVPWFRRPLGGLGALAAVVVVGVVVAGGLLARAGVLQVGSPSGSPDALARIRAAGSLRVAITTGAPQVAGAGGSYLGYDVDVAGVIAEELGVDAIRSFRTTSEILDPPSRSGWDVALAGGATDTGLRETSPYYHWPVWLVVTADSSLTRLDGLAARSVCVVERSVGAGWLSGDRAGARGDPPVGATPVPLADDDACLDALASGAADAAVTATLLESDFAGRGVRALGGPVAVDDRGALVGGGADPDTLATRIDGAIADLAGSGRLAQLSRAAFGVDLTDPVP
jgi:ABC-type amino acid transport substrate-binding protein